MKFFSIKDDKENSFIDLAVNSEGLLFGFINTGPKTDVTIPHILPDGSLITSLCIDFCKGEYGRIIISDEINKVYPYAFRNAFVEEVVWPSSCQCVPDGCFFGCSVHRVTNLNNVNNICKDAFRGTYSLAELDFSFSPLKCVDIEDFEDSCVVHWPDGIKFSGCFDGIKFKIDGYGCLTELQNRQPERAEVTIPKVLPNGAVINSIGSNFVKGQFKEITISDEIETIAVSAFRHADVCKVNWSASCRVIPASCFYFSSVQQIANLDHVTHIEKYAFLNTFSLSDVDLSSSSVSCIDPHSFDKKCRVKLPYYISQ